MIGLGVVHRVLMMCGVLIPLMVDVAVARGTLANNDSRAEIAAMSPRQIAPGPTLTSPFAPFRKNAAQNISAICGDAMLDTGESCDDGNTSNADGCDSSCQVEPGWACSLPVPPVTQANLIDDGGFEAGLNSVHWAQTATSYPPICDAPSCTAGQANLAYAGDFWAWFGGAVEPESQSLSQSVAVTQAADVLSFQLMVGVCDSDADALRVTIDGNEVFSTNPCTVSQPLTYSRQSIDLVSAPGGPYNDGQAHLLAFQSETFAINGGNSNFFVDDIELLSPLEPPIAPVPSACSQLPEICYEENFDADGFDYAGWTRFSWSAVQSPWGLTNDGVCGSGNGTPGNYTGGSGEAACLDSDAHQAGPIDSFMCTPILDLTLPAGTLLRYQYNYQVSGTPGPDDFLQAMAGTAPPTPLNVAFYSLLASTTVSAGAFEATPGVNGIGDLSLYEGEGEVWVCFRYGGNFDWYAQIDDVRVTAVACDGLAEDTDGDGVLDDIDNCTLVANASQLDSNGDGFGNLCDGDLYEPNDCVVNFLDLAGMRAAFFTNDASPAWNPHADLSGDGLVNFGDLAIIKASMFAAPGPAAAVCQ